jgi:hypothetical protein
MREPLLRRNPMTETVWLITDWVVLNTGQLVAVEKVDITGEFNRVRAELDAEESR